MTSIRTDMGVAILTKEGGFAFPSINATGATSIPGTIVYPSPTADDSFELAPAGCETAIGVVYNAVANGEVAWVVTSGRGYVLLETGYGCDRGDAVGVSDTEDGRGHPDASESLIATTLQTIAPPDSGSILVLCIIGTIRGGNVGPSDWYGYFPGGWS